MSIFILLMKTKYELGNAAGSFTFKETTTTLNFNSFSKYKLLKGSSN